MTRQTCHWHCGGCQGHFSSLAAFDRHRKGMECNIIVGPKGLQVWTEDGSCERVKGCWVEGKRDHWVEPVTIYQVYGSSYTGPKEE